MNERLLLGEITFLEQASKYYRFPLMGSIRTSFWLDGDKGSTFSEVLFENKLNIGVKCVVKIRVAEQAFMEGRMIEGVKFELGVYPYGIASGCILKVLN